MESTVNIPVWIFEGIGAFLLTQTVLAIWWAATITEKISNQTEKLDELRGFAKQEYVDKELGKVQKDVDAAHRRIDEIQLAKGA